MLYLKFNIYKIALSNWLHLSMLTLFFLSCGGIRKEEKPNNSKTIDWRKYRITKPDSNRYIKFAYVSSQRYPLEKYGIEQITDGQISTFWSSQPGLNRGEWVMFKLDSLLNAQSLIIKLYKHPISAKVHYFNVYINDTLVGRARPDNKFLIQRPIHKIKIEAGEVIGYNTIRFPILNDSIGKWKIIKQTATQSYNSKALAITEIVFYNKSGKKIPLKVHPQYKIRLNMQGIVDAKMKHTISDGNRKTALMFSEEVATKTLVFHFDSIRPICGIRIWADFGGSDTMELVLKNPQQSIKGRVFTVKKNQSTTFLFTDSCFAGKIAQLNFNKPNAYVFLQEIQFFDGVKWYGFNQNIGDIQNLLRDSLGKTLLYPLMDVYTAASIVKEKTDTIFKDQTLSSKKNVSAQAFTIKKEREKETFNLILRSNHSFELSHSLKTINKDGTAPPENKKIKQFYFGNWRLENVAPQQVQIHMIGTIRLSVFKEGKCIRVNYLHSQEKKATIKQKHITFPGIGTLYFAY